MVRTTKKFRVFESRDGLYVRPVSKGDIDQGKDLVSMLGVIPTGGHAPQEVRGSEYLEDECMTRYLRGLRRALMAVILLSVPSMLYMINSKTMPWYLPLLMFVPIGVCAAYILTLSPIQIRDGAGNVFDTHTGVLQLTDGTTVTVTGGYRRGR